MAADDEFPSRDELDELDDLMKRAGWPAETRDEILATTALDRDFYDDYWEKVWVDAAANQDRDGYWPYEDYRGTFSLGTDPEGRPVSVTRRQLNEHMMVVGRTGAGKTTFFYNVMDALNERDIPFMAFDFKNDRVRICQARFRIAFVDRTVVTASSTVPRYPCRRWV